MAGTQHRWRLRALLVAIAAVLATGGGVLAARLAPADEVVVVPTITTSTTEAAPVVRVRSSPVPTLPVPEPSPLDPYAPTPELRHGMLEIPAIGLAQPFFEGVTLTAIDRGPSHWPGTAMPGETGNVVIAGHRTTHSRPFYDLDRLKPGDELIFTMATGDRYVYALDRTEVVDDQAIHIVDQTYQRTATLFACHPRGSARQRIVGHFTLQSPSLP